MVKLILIKYLLTSIYEIKQMRPIKTIGYIGLKITVYQLCCFACRLM